MPTVRRYYAACSRGLDVVYSAGTFESLGNRMALHVWAPQPDTVRGSVVILHGYLAHPVQLADLIRAFLRDGFVVAAPELPGHGLSGGERGFIAEFADYGRFFADFWESAGADLPGPVHAVGFSTGASTLLEYLETEGDPFGAIVFASPLVRSHRYFWSRLGRLISRPFVKSVRTGYDDVLGTQRMPLAWFDAQVRWNKENDDYGPFDRQLLVIQGDRDTVVNRRYNRRFLEARFTAFSYLDVPGAKHVVFRGTGERSNGAVDAALTHVNALYDR